MPTAQVLRPHVKTVGTKTTTWNELHILCSLIIHQTRELTKQFLQENNLNQFSNLSNNDINIQKLWWLKVRVVMVTRVSELAPREWRLHGTDSERQISWTVLFNINDKVILKFSKQNFFIFAFKDACKSQVSQQNNFLMESSWYKIQHLTLQHSEDYFVFQSNTSENSFCRVTGSSKISLKLS